MQALRRALAVGSFSDAHAQRPTPPHRPNVPLARTVAANRYKIRGRGARLADWHYIGHYGQLGPLTQEQVEELIDGGAIVADTYVWRTGMPDWQPAERVPELRGDTLRLAEPYAAPPPPPAPGTRVAAPPAAPPMGQLFAYRPMPATQTMRTRVLWRRAATVAGRWAGCFRSFPASAACTSRYLRRASARTGHGDSRYPLRLVAFVDGIILTGGVKLDGYGRQLGAD